MIKRNVEVYDLIRPEINKLSETGIETATLDCRLLLSYILEKKRPLYAHEQVDISNNQIQVFKTLVQERQSGKPVSRIINKKNFWKREFEINNETLDPRPDTETLLESVLKHYPNKSQALKFLDLGSGSGCLGLSLLEEYKNSKVSFLDASKKSLEIVKVNAKKFGLFERFKTINLDWKSSDWDIKLLNLEENIKFDIIVSNPPYIPSAQITNLQTEVKIYDPEIALDGGKDGLSAYRSIIPRIKNIIKKNGKLFIEIGKGQDKSVTKIGSKYSLSLVNYQNDLSGIIRAIIFIY